MNKKTSTRTRPKKAPARRSARTPTQASQADRYALYLESVQDPEHEVKMMQRVFRDAYGKPALTLREDFCGTAAVCARWVRGSKDRRAWGVDLDGEPLAWGRQHNLSPLSSDEQSRVTLLQQDVRRVTSPRVDVVAAQNFSFFVFKTRADLRHYFSCVRQSVQEQGVFLLDMVGGPLMQEDKRVEKRRVGRHRYHWEQEWFDPITHHTMFHIHFKFPDGSFMERAFSYDWRLWTLPEVRELLEEAGFRQSHVYYNQFHPVTGEDMGTYKKQTRADADSAWLAYVVALP